MHLPRPHIYCAGLHTDSRAHCYTVSCADQRTDRYADRRAC